MLDRETTEVLLTDTAMISTVESLQEYLLSSSVLADIRRRIKAGVLGDQDIAKFVRELMSQFTPGASFFGDSLLALVAIVLSRKPGKFAQETLAELADLDVAEIQKSPRIARKLLKERNDNLTDVINREEEFYRAFSDVFELCLDDEPAWIQSENTPTKEYRWAS